MAKKEYIVSFVDQDTQSAQAAEILSTATQNVKDGVETLIAETAPSEGDVLHFGEIGSCAAVLTETECEKLRKDDRVAEVVEDIEVFALGCGTPEAPDEDPCAPTEAAQWEMFDAGYEQAMFDMWGAADGGDEQMADESTASLPSSWAPSRSPLWPGPGRGRLPIPPPRVCPPGTRPVVRCVPWRRPVPPIRRQPPEWNIRMVAADRVWRRVTGRGVKVAIIDTGIDDNHPDLTVSGGASFVPGVASWDDDNRHGTHCAGIVGARNNAIGVVGVAPECSLYAIKVLSGAGSGRLSWILAGMGWALRNGMDVASMSLGSEVAGPDAPCIVAYQRAADRLIRGGCLVVAAAGNSGRGPRPWVGNPARCRGFMAVAAVDRGKRIADFSSRGPGSLGPEEGVEISAPGVSIRSTVPGGRYATLSGTSMACPHVSGATALLKQLHPTWSPARLRTRLKRTASDLGAPGNDSTYGAGLLDCRAAVFG